MIGDGDHDDQPIVRAYDHVHESLMHTIDRTTPPRRTRGDYSPEFKRVLVARSLMPGASVSAIALEAGINANLLFTWRREERAAAAASPMPALLPVTVHSPEASCAPEASAPDGLIEIDIGRARIRVRGVVDERRLRFVLQALHALA